MVAFSTIKLELHAKAGAEFFSNYINAGAFDIAEFGWVGDAFPLSMLTPIYTSDGDSNFGKIGGHRIDAAIERTLEELDPGKARALANEVDKLIWAEDFSLPLTQSAGVVAVHSTLANFGATAIATWTTPPSGSCEPKPPRDDSCHAHARRRAGTIVTVASPRPQPFGAGLPRAKRVLRPYPVGV